MTSEDLPEELDAQPPNDFLDDSLRTVFAGAHMVAIHFRKGLIATWSGGTGFNVYDPCGWFNHESGDPFRNATGDSGEVYHFNVMGDDTGRVTPQHARDKLEEYGFNVVGRGEGR